MVSIHIDATMQVSIAKYYSLYIDYMYVCLLIRFTPTKIHQGLPPINSQKTSGMRDVYICGIYIDIAFPHRVHEHDFV